MEIRSRVLQQLVIIVTFSHSSCSKDIDVTLQSDRKVNPQQGSCPVFDGCVGYIHAAVCCEGTAESFNKVGGGSGSVQFISIADAPQVLSGGATFISCIGEVVKVVEGEVCKMCVNAGPI